MLSYASKSKSASGAIFSKGSPMTTDIQKIISEAMQLDSSARAFIVETLLESLEVGTDFEVSAEWRAEIQRRCAEIDSGAVTLIPGDQAIAELRTKYSA